MNEKTATKFLGRSRNSMRLND